MSPKKEIYRHTFLVSEIMCGSCGYLLGEAIFADAFKGSSLLPQDAHITIDENPSSTGLHRLLVTIESAESEKPLNEKQITDIFENTICSTSGGDGKKFAVIHSEDDLQKIEKKRTNWLNLTINLVLLIGLILLSVLLPPSLPLTIGLITISFLATAFTSRHYFIAFWRNLRARKPLTMATGVSVGWGLSLIHALYHTISMPAMLSVSMSFMNTVMPVMLITIVNVLDEIQYAVQKATARMQLQEMGALFQFSEHYESCEPPDTGSWQKRRKAALKEGMWVRIQPGECIPADSKIVQGQSLMNTAVMNGETKRVMRAGDKISAGVINLGSSVTIEIENLAFYSLTNQIVFGAHRKQKKQATSARSERLFILGYAAIILISIALAIVVPHALGVLTLPLALQSLIGIVFAICPCTMAIAHRLPSLLLQHRLHHHDILLRDEHFLDHADELHTIVFDKTGTLTTENSKVVFTDIADELWTRVCLLEKHGGTGHPLAKAICDHKSLSTYDQIMMTIVPDGIKWDEHNRGLEGIVQNHRIQVGSYAYLKERNVENLPAEKDFSPVVKQHIEQGYTPIFVAQDDHYRGSIFVEHEIDPAILKALQTLHDKKIKLILLTGDTKNAAKRFNKRCGDIFEIKSDQLPHKKEETVTELMHSLSDKEARGFWFVGDNTNDLLCAAYVSGKGGVACAMNHHNQTAYYADVVLNGSLDYVLQQCDLNRCLQKNIAQNQAILAYTAVIFLAMLVCLPIAGVGMTPLIPLLLMVSTTGVVLFNTARLRMTVDVALDKRASWLKRFLASDISLTLLMSSSLFLVASLLVMVFAGGHLALPALVFSAGVSVGVSSGFLLTAVVMLGGLVGLMTAGAIYHRMMPTRLTHRTPSSTTAPDLSKEIVELAPRRERSWSVIEKTTPLKKNVLQKTVEPEPGAAPSLCLLS